MCLVIKIHEIEIATLQHCNIATLHNFLGGCTTPEKVEWFLT